MHIKHSRSAALLRIVVYNPNVEQQLKSRSYTSYKIGMKMLTLPEYGFFTTCHSIRRRTDGQSHAPSGTLDSKMSSTCAKHVENNKVGARGWLASNFGLDKDSGFVNEQTHQVGVFVPLHPTKVTRTTSIMSTNVTTNQFGKHSNPAVSITSTSAY